VGKGLHRIHDNRRMWTAIPAAWTVRGATFALWALALASTVAWGLKLGGSGRTVPVPAASARPVPAADPAAIARLLGGGAVAAGVSAPVASLASRFQLMGVVAEVHSGGGAAVIAVDGKPAKPFRVGASVDEGVVLQSVRGRQAVLGAPNGPALVTLEVPLLRWATPQAPIAAPR
jgi:general secretion pathway protein C